MEQRVMPYFVVGATLLFALAVWAGFSVPVQTMPPHFPPNPKPPTFVPYHRDAMNDSAFKDAYGVDPSQVFARHPEVLKAVQKIDPGFDGVHSAEAANMSIAAFADSRAMLVISGCVLHAAVAGQSAKPDCVHGGYAAGYVVKVPGGKTPAISQAFLIETNDPVHLQGIIYGSPDESYTRALTEELGRITH